MTLSKMPLLAWLNMVMTGMVLLTISPLTAAQIMLIVDRYMGGHFFDTQAGGSAVIWMHFFWIFGHPEVYILVIPAFAVISEIVPVFSRKVIFGYPIMVAATVAIGFLSMSVWAHHMFTVGMSANANTFFVITTMAISVPTGIKIFNWLATMLGRKDSVQDAHAVLHRSFLFQFLIAGLTGIMLAAAPFDWQLGGSYFLVAHFHYVIVGGILFALFGAFYYWFPKMSGKLYNETLGRWHFWLFVVGFHLTFDFMHIPGILGMPRRIYTYEPGRGWDIWNLIVTVGVVFQAVSTLVVFLYNLLWSYFSGETAGNDPWDAWTLEWSTSSPPPDHNFATIPTVRSRCPLSGSSSIRKIRTGTTNRNLYDCTTGNKLGTFRTRARGYVRLGHRRNRNLYDFRRGLPLLRWQECDGPAAEGCARSAYLLHHLFTFEQPDDSFWLPTLSVKEKPGISRPGGAQQFCSVPLFYLAQPPSGSG